jgi:hypothetical protein
MGRKLRPGRATVAGLLWLARVGPAPLDAWRVAMGWGRSAAYSHASRLIEMRWAATTTMGRGAGSLIHPTRDGLQVVGVQAIAPGRPGPTWWAHCAGCAWTAAWLTQRGQLHLGCRELVGDDGWRGELRWRDRGGWRTSGHHPDLVRVIEQTPVAVEVELARKSSARLSAILELHALWRSQGKTGGVMYICGTNRTAERVERAAQRHGLSRGRGGLGLRTLPEVRAEARELASRQRSDTA